MLFRLLLAMMFLSTASHAAPGDLWEGTWENRDHKTIWLFQNGETVWGSSTHGYRYHAQVSPDGRTLRGTYYQKNHKQGLFEFTLTADSQEYIGNTVSRSGAPDNVPVATNATTDGERVIVDYVRTDYVADGFADGPQGFDNVFDTNNPMHVAWINYQSPYEQPAAPRVDIDDLRIPAAGNAGLWQVIDSASGLVGTVGMNRNYDGSFVAAGQIRLPDFQGGTPLRATFTETGNGQTLDSLRLRVVAGRDMQTQTVNIRQTASDTYLVRIDGLFMGREGHSMQLVQIAGSVPAGPPTDISGLEIPAPGNLGLMRVTAYDHGQIGTVSWDQPGTSVVMTGQIIIPEALNGAPIDIIILDSPNDSSDSVSLQSPQANYVRLTAADIREMDGDQYIVTLPADVLESGIGPYRMTVSFIAGSRPAADRGNTEAANTLSDFRIRTDNVPIGLSVSVYQEPDPAASVVGMFQRDATNLNLWGCVPALSVPDSQLTGAALHNVLDDRICKINTPSLSGWVNGNYLTR